MLDHGTTVLPGENLVTLLKQVELGIDISEDASPTLLDVSTVNKTKQSQQCVLIYARLSQQFNAVIDFHIHKRIMNK